MLNKLKFNNLVISNKKGIQQSRIQTINKLVHKIRKLKTLLEKHPDNLKCKERIRKSTETMEILKKLKRVDVMKNVLLMDKPAPAIITNGISTPEEVAIALLSMNKIMQGLIKRFRTELQINDPENNGWREVLQESSKRRQKLERTEEKRKKRLELKQQKALGRKRQEWLEENQPNIKQENMSIETNLVSTTGDWQMGDLSSYKVTETEILKKSNKVFKTKKEIPTVSNNSTSNKTLKKETEKNKVEEEENIYNVKSNINGKAQITENSNQTEKSNESECNSEESLVIDPFFITDSGENYLSTAINNPGNLDGEENFEEKKDLHMVNLSRRDNNSGRNKDFGNKKRPQNANKWNKNVEKQNEWNNKRDNSNMSQSKWNEQKNFKTRQQEPNRKAFESKSEEKSLHPSWAAKQKYKPIITGFQGKRITFEDKDFGQKHEYPEKDFKANKATTERKPNSNEKDSLHPSWAAKQKLKPSITTFQGKKITFDNNE